MHRLLAFACLLCCSGCFLLRPQMRPAPPEPVQRTAERLERGRYLVEHVMACSWCHSQHDWTRYLGPKVPGTEYGGGVCLGPKDDVNGELCTQNISSHADGMGWWSDGEIIRAVREGVGRDGRALFPFMPYERYRVLSDEDAAAMVVYLRTLPARGGKPPPVHIRWPTSMLLNFVPRPLPGPQAEPPAADRLARGRYLAELAMCDHCHTAQPKGMRKPGRDFAGGFDLRGPWGRVVSPNITPDATGLGTTTREEFVGRFKSFLEADDAAVAMPAGATIMPWRSYAHMSEEDLGLIYDWLMAQKPVENVVAPFGPFDP